MKDFKKLREEALRQQQRHEEVFKEGDIVMSARTGDRGHIHRVGGNYAIVISKMEICSVSGLRTLDL
ncbi:MAG: hypothetical protein CM15mV3_1610 [Caudoviricetes sp.]|nr:MAG: hypothetical protein CM15mV3_1610 [Caudoviricetes sp.]